MPRTRASYRAKKKQPETHSPVVVPSVPSTPSLTSSMKQGFGFGLGSSIAHTMVGSMFQRSTKPDCQPIQKDYEQCLVDSECSKERLGKLYTDLQQCSK